jgi:hypothetical protein
MMGFTSRSSIMTDKPKKLTDTARALLAAATMRNDYLIALPPVAAARQIVRSLLNAGSPKRCRRQLATPDTLGAPARMVAW